MQTLKVQVQFLTSDGRWLGTGNACLSIKEGRAYALALRSQTGRSVRLLDSQGNVLHSWHGIKAGV